MLMLPMRDEQTNEQITSEDRATQLLICEPLSFAISSMDTCIVDTSAWVIRPERLKGAKDEVKRLEARSQARTPEGPIDF